MCLYYEAKYQIVSAKAVVQADFPAYTLSMRMQIPLRIIKGYNSNKISGERGGSVVECRTPEREVGGSKPTAAMLCP